jgi:hypothetical protein
MIQAQRGKAVGLLLLVFLAGCGGSDGRSAKLAPVSGRVLYKDQAVTAAEIYFLPDAEKGNNGTMGSAVLQEDGSFTITTYPKGNGVAPGAYKVTLGLGRRSDKELNKYRRVETTPLEVEVPEEGLSDLVLDLSNPKKER